MKKLGCCLAAICLCCFFLATGGAEPDEKLPATLYYNPQGGRYYHADAECPSVKADYLPMTAFDSELLGAPEYNALEPCPRCVPTAETSASLQRAESAETNPGLTVSSIGSQEAARLFAESFFASPYLDALQDGRTLIVTQTTDGWQAVLSSADEALPALTIWFTAAGRIQQYQNSAYALPTLDGFAIGESGSLEDARRLDALRDALFPNMENNEGGVFARDGETAFYAMDRFSAWLGLIMGADTPKLVAYGDFGTDAARYPGYLTRGEAAAAARRALADAYGLSAEQAKNLVLMQADFILREGVWTDADVPLPYWFFVFGDETDDLKSQYKALIDAETGEGLELYDPATSGNG